MDMSGQGTMNFLSEAREVWESETETNNKPSATPHAMIDAFCIIVLGWTVQRKDDG